METATELTPRERIHATAKELGLSMAAVFVPWSQSRNKGEKEPSLNWRITLKRDGRDVLTTDYMAGSGHCPGYQRKDKYLKRELIVWECEHGRPGFVMESAHQIVSAPRGRGTIDLDFESVLSSLALDSDVLDHPTFELWAGDFGYDTDSRKAETIYRACLEIALALRNAIGEDGLARLREACRDF